MIRVLFPALILAGPATAHTSTHVHAHGTDYATLGVGLALVALSAVVVIAKLKK